MACVKVLLWGLASWLRPESAPARIVTAHDGPLAALLPLAAQRAVALRLLWPPRGAGCSCSAAVAATCAAARAAVPPPHTASPAPPHAGADAAAPPLTLRLLPHAVPPPPPPPPPPAPPGFFEDKAADAKARGEVPKTEDQMAAEYAEFMQVCVCGVGGGWGGRWGAAGGGSWHAESSCPPPWGSGGTWSWLQAWCRQPRQGKGLLQAALRGWVQAWWRPGAGSPPGEGRGGE